MEKEADKEDDGEVEEGGKKEEEDGRAFLSLLLQSLTSGE